MNSKRNARFIVLLTLVCLLGTLPAAADQLASVSAAGTTLDFAPQKSFHSLVLTVSAPDGQVYSQEFVNSAPSFSIVDEFGLMPDGSYTYELVAIPAPRSREDIGAVTGAPQLQSGAFLVSGGAIIAGGAQEGGPTKDIIHNDDVIITRSLCVGTDCVNGESFGFDTIRLKENNLRIKFQDTSVGSFPSTDWQLTANDSASGGANKFSIDDITGGRTPFTVEANAPSHSLYVDDGGRIGFGTSIPVVELHVKDGDTPTLRLEQDGSSGFAPQTWDVAGNETNFFVRDATNGSLIPFKIRPTAPANSLYVNTNGNVGIGTSSPDAPLSVERTNGTTVLAEFETNGVATIQLNNTTAASVWEFKVNATGDFAIDDTGDGFEMLVTTDGQMRLMPQATAPAACNEGAIYYDSDGSGALCFCGPTNTWTAIITNAGGNCT